MREGHGTSGHNQRAAHNEAREEPQERPGCSHFDFQRFPRPTAIGGPLMIAPRPSGCNALLNRRCANKHSDATSPHFISAETIQARDSLACRHARPLSREGPAEFSKWQLAISDQLVFRVCSCTMGRTIGGREPRAGAAGARAEAQDGHASASILARVVARVYSLTRPALLTR